MMKLLYIPKELKNIKDRPKVYFCCHPEDFDRCFDVLSKDVMSKQKCTIWYAQDLSESRDEEYLENLRQMQLFLLPVTSKLLDTDNIALNVEFCFATDNHIPVLPIMMESSLEEKFNKKCGNLQFLDKYSCDVTAISYDEKLTKFLESVLVGDETAQRIRDAFDAYIFLSYRKKDRRYAQELMRLIHKNDFCRDIAIWYDEFLSIGENFNENIAEALNKSQLFALAVTPNLINEENYVQSTEYPMAVDAHKVIVPAELVPTDRELLREKFKGIPEVVDTKTEGELSSALMKALEQIAIKENDKSPEHNFFIGLAYLSGIDVEVDFDRAVELITSSAEAGLAEAAGKLADMYHKGIGVKRDYHIAIKWQEKGLEIWKNKYKENPCDELLEVVFLGLMVCVEWYIEAYDYDSALDICMQAKTIYLQNHKFLNQNCRLKLFAECYYNLGEVNKHKGCLHQALEYYRKALETREKLAIKAGDTVDKKLLALDYNAMGNIYVELEDLPQAQECYRMSLVIREDIAEQSGTTEDLRALSVSYELMGNVLNEQGDSDNALEHLLKAMNLREKICQETETEQSFEDLAIIYNNAGDVFVTQHSYKSALNYYQKALEIREKLAKDNDSIHNIRGLAVCYEKMCDVLLVFGKLKKVHIYYQGAVALREKVAETTGYREDYDDLATVCYNGSLVLVSKKKRRVYLEKALHICQELINMYPQVKRYRELSDYILKEMNCVFSKLLYRWLLQSMLSLINRISDNKFIK